MVRNNNKPIENDARRPVGHVKPLEVKLPPKPVTIDPRFSDLSGSLNQGLYEASYEFLDEIKAKEEKQLKSQLRRLKMAKRPEAIDQKKKAAARLSQLKHEKREKQRVAGERKAKQTWRKQENALVEKGKTPFFPKKRELKKAELKEKFDVLKKEGKLDSFLTKQRKKQALKDAEVAPELSTFAPRRY
ncbi:Ribosomal RNA processing protein 36-like protein [Diplonema papillatum]|nr:Ribosomal RNA processing protein 36-like protein [Diplonema papillatum]